MSWLRRTSTKSCFRINLAQRGWTSRISSGEGKMTNRINLRIVVVAALFLVVIGSANANANPVSLWKLDEGSGTTASDSMGTNHGTLINEPNWGPGVDGNCIEFDGINDYVEVADDNSLDFSAGQDFSIACWFTIERPTYTVAQDILSKRETGGDMKGWRLSFSRNVQRRGPG
jgi:hypothetical protein